MVIFSAAILIFSAGLVGRSAKQNILGIFVDARGRFSLSQFQIVLWTILVLSLLSGVFFARLFGEVENPLNVTIPNELLMVMGISVGPAAVSAAVKASKDIKNTPIIGRNEPKFSQLYLVEEGTDPETVDITRFQNFWLTIIVVIAYLATAIAYIDAQNTLADINSLASFNGTLVNL